MVGEFSHGIAAYVTDLAHGWNKKGGIELSFLTAPGLKERSPWNLFQCIETPIGFLDPRELWALSSLIQKSSADLFHSPSFSSLLNCPIPWVQTIHDLNHLHFGSFAQKMYYRWILKRSALGARALMTVSEAMRVEISTWLGVLAESLSVVPNAISAPSKPSLKTHRWNVEPKRYFFCLAHAKPHKNIPFLIEAYRRSKSKWPLLISAPPIEPTPAGVNYLGPLADDEVELLLSQAGALLSPSLYEGFGRPPIEALVRGVPVLVSDIQSHREILREVPVQYAKQMRPDDGEGWTQAIRAIESQGLTSVPNFISQKLLEQFSVEEQVKKVDQVYRSVLGMHS